MDHSASGLNHWAAVSPVLSSDSIMFENSAATSVYLINIEVLEQASTSSRIQDRLFHNTLSVIYSDLSSYSV